MAVDHLATVNIGIQMKRKKLTKTFKIISNWHHPLVSMFYGKIFQRREGQCAWASKGGRVFHTRHPDCSLPVAVWFIDKQVMYIDSGLFWSRQGNGVVLQVIFTVSIPICTSARLRGPVRGGGGSSAFSFSTIFSWTCECSQFCLFYFKTNVFLRRNILFYWKKYNRKNTIYFVPKCNRFY